MNDQDESAPIPVADVLQAAGIAATPVTVDEVDEWTGRGVTVETNTGDQFRIVPFPDSEALARKEAAIRQRVRAETTVPVMPIVAVVPAQDAFQYPMIIARDEGGLPVFDIAGLSPSKQIVLFEEFGAALAALHDIGFDQFGPVGTDGQTVIDGTSTWRERMFSRLTKGIDSLEDTAFASYHDAATALVESTRADLRHSFDPVLVKHTYQFEQVLVTPESEPLVQAIRGFERALAAPAEYGYAVARWQLCDRAFRSPSFKEAFETEYLAHTAIDEDPAADRRQSLYHLEQLLVEISTFEQTRDSEGENDDATRRRDRLRQHLDRVLSM